VIAPSLSVRLFSPRDAAPLMDLLHSAYAELGASGLNYTAVDQDEDTTLRRASAGRCWVVERDGALVATLTVSLPPSAGLRQLTAEAAVADRAWLNQVAVSPELRGTGVASHLWQLGRTWARTEGATSFGVDTAEPAEHLVHMYTRWGFQSAGVIHWSGKTYDSVVMTRSLIE
jgi:GNAT superfamily N-acetyltransferase